MTTNAPGWLTRLTCVLSLAFSSVVYAQSLAPEQADHFDGETLTFEQAVERALGQNPQIVVAKNELFRARALLEQVRSQSIPTLTANGSYTRLDNNRVIASTVNGVTTDEIAYNKNQLAANLTFSWLISPKAWTQWAHAGDNVNVASLSLEDTLRLVGLMAGRAYLTVLTQRNLVMTSRTARDAAKAHAEYAQARLQGGVGNRIDFVRAQQELATSESQLASAKVQLLTAREALGVLVGVDHPVDGGVEPDLVYRGTLEDALSESNQRSDVRELTLKRDAAHRVTRDSWSDYMPYMQALFQPFYENPPTLTMPKTGWQAELLLTMPLYDGGLRYGQRKERTALEREAQANLDNTIRQAHSDVRVAFDSVRETDRALFSAREAARYAKEAVALANLSYREGTATNLDLIDAERQARDTDTDAALAADASRQAQLDLLQATGRFPKVK